MTKHITGKLEILNKALQCPQHTLAGMGEAVSLIKDSITILRSEEEFQHIVVEKDRFTTEHDLKMFKSQDNGNHITILWASKNC
ncbi:hypothetical protein PR048_028315 [Dryococelus australis]|uniref:Uncharacterized protein n=1 Tax=Dryococelus australis TaxID=614101 RepID=A0ABQ9GIY8_9NEOP|nr:hypothetical protein PR048_028315 [Dryococelus australis]